MKQRSLTKKFVSSMCIITVIVLIITSAVTLVISMRMFKNSTEDSMEQLAMMGYMKVDSWFADKEQLLMLVAGEIPMFAYEDKEGVESYLERYCQGDYPYITDIFVTTPDNEMYSGIRYVSDGSIDWHSRYWYYGAKEAGGLVYTSPYISADEGNPMIISLSVPVVDKYGADMGVLCMDLELNALIDFINEERIMDTSGRAFLLDQNGNFVTHDNPDFSPRIRDGNEVFTSFDQVGIDLGKPIFSDKIKLSRGQDWDHIRKYFAVVDVERNGWIYGFHVPVADFYGEYLHLGWIWLLMVAAMIAISLLLSNAMSRKLLIPIREIIGTANTLAMGDNNVEIDVRTGDELQDLSHQFRKMISSNAQQIDAIKQMADGDFTIQITPKSDKDTLSNTINYMVGKLRKLLADINVSISMFVGSTVEIATAAQQLAVGTQQQTSAVDELSQSLDNILQNTRDNAKLANNAANTIDLVRDKAHTGSQSMENMLEAVLAIDHSSRDIAKIINVIEDLAFQTNILALNAAVEAARAGQHGKGFAVVADEVRTLAAHSAQAAKEITDLIQKSSQTANDGVETAQRTQQILSEIVASISSTAEIVQNIDVILDAQVDEIGQITENVVQITNVVQLNSATAEETAAASEEMSSQAQLLGESMKVFRTGQPHRPPAKDRKQRSQSQRSLNTMALK